MCEEDEKIIHRLKYYNDEDHLAKRIVELQHCIEDLRNQLQQKDNIIKEVNDYIESDKFYNIFYCCEERNKVKKEIKQILDKVGDSNK